MEHPASAIARDLAGQAERLCRRFLSNGHREGNYWVVGDVRNMPGRSLYVRLRATPDGTGRPGKWTDAATGEHGDLLDIIAVAGGHDRLRDALDEARRFLSLAMPEPVADQSGQRRDKAPTGTPEAARRLFAASRPVAGSIVDTYLCKRGLVHLRGCDALRFHPHCYYRPSRDDIAGSRAAWPAMIAAVTDGNGRLTGVHRTWLDPATQDKAPIDTPRRAMGNLLGHGVRFGAAGDVMAAGEGIETMGSLRSLLPAMPMIAALSAAHLAAILFPVGLRRLYVARDDDPAGDAAVARLIGRAVAAGIEVVPLSPLLGDFNEDLRLLGATCLRAALQEQLASVDADRFLANPD
ncbi:MAG: primase [Bradyrhizobium sp.]|nr:primase [Bradyrhizobium sp.]